MEFWEGLVLGIMVGGVFGCLGMGILAGSKCAECRTELVQAIEKKMKAPRIPRDGVN